MSKKMQGIGLALGLFMTVAQVQSQESETGGGQAEGASSPASKRSAKIWFKNLIKGLSKSPLKGRYKRQKSTAAVAAVRGADQSKPLDDPKKPYVKDPDMSKRAAAKSAEEKELLAAVKLVDEGQLEEGRKGIREFMERYPNSPLIDDAKQSLQMIGELEVAEEPQGSK